MAHLRALALLVGPSQSACFSLSPVRYLRSLPAGAEHPNPQGDAVGAGPDVRAALPAQRRLRPVGL